jgi:hypothetical protein
MTREKLEHAQRPSVTDIKMSIKKLITAYPMLFGALIGLVIFGAIIVIETWFPWIGKAWERHNKLVQSAWFTAGFFGVWVSRYWRWRRRGFFWASMCIFLLVHTLGVLYYATQIHPLALREWIVLLTVESFVVVFYMDWSTRRFGHPSRHRHSDGASGKPGGA